MRPRIDRLGIKPGLRVAVIGVDDPALFGELRERSDQIVVGMPRTKRDVILYGAPTLEALAALETLRERIVPTGAIWTIYRKDDAQAVRADDVISAARRVGMIDNKAISFSDTHAALRLVIPASLRER